MQLSKFWGKTAWVPVLALDLRQVANFSVPQFPNLSNRITGVSTSKALLECVLLSAKAEVAGHLRERGPGVPQTPSCLGSTVGLWPPASAYL